MNKEEIILELEYYYQIVRIGFAQGGSVEKYLLKRINKTISKLKRSKTQSK